jgi:vacuolar-type H+-ATPase subunit H
MTRWFDDAEQELVDAYNDGQLDDREFKAEMRRLRDELRDEADQAADEARDRVLEGW